MFEWKIFLAHLFVWLNTSNINVPSIAQIGCLCQKFQHRALCISNHAQLTNVTSDIGLKMENYA